MNIGLIGDVSVGKTSILRIFARHLKNEKVIDGGLELVKANFSNGFKVVEKNKKESLNEKGTGKIQSEKVVFFDTKTNKPYTIFSISSNPPNSLVKASLITISRICTQIIVVFAVDRDLKSQLKILNEIRFFPNLIYICLNKIDLLKESLNSSIKNIKREITKYFKKRSVNIHDFFITCSELVERFENYNDNIIKMILQASDLSIADPKPVPKKQNSYVIKPIKIIEPGLVIKVNQDLLRKVRLKKEKEQITKKTAPLVKLEDKPRGSSRPMSKLIVFVSYATVDSDHFQIKYIAEKLTLYPEINDVFYWEEDMHDNIFKYMNDNLEKCDVFLLFCSESSLKSNPIELEWMTALKLKKKIIPIFNEANNIPPLLTTFLGIEFSKSNIDDIITKLYSLILKKSGDKKRVK